jgi:hypothetical protein
MRTRSFDALTALAALGLGSAGVLGAVGAASVATAQAGRPPAIRGAAPARAGTSSPPTFGVTEILSGVSLHHAFTPAGTTTTMTEALSHPDDITRLGNALFVGFQNGVGPQGEPAADGNTDSTVVELDLRGRPVDQWDVTGKADGVTADPAAGDVVATVDEDANSALYTIRPGTHPAADGITRYVYDETLPHGGGTDAVSVDGGRILVSASAPGTNGLPPPQPTYPADYRVRLDQGSQVATVTPLFFDEAPATVANVHDPRRGQSVPLALTDPDSDEIVPPGRARFAGDFVLTSQGDLEQVYVSDATGAHQRRAVLALSQPVDDTAWTAGPGTLYATDSTHDAVDTVTGPFADDRPMVVATPCGSNSAPSPCPAPPAFPASSLATMDPWTGQVTSVVTKGAAFVPQGGLVFVAGPGYRARSRR